MHNAYTYYADFSSVDPSLREYVEGINRIQASQDTGDSWQSHLKAISPIKLLKSNSIPSTVEKVEQFAVKERLNRNEHHMDRVFFYLVPTKNTPAVASTSRRSRESLMVMLGL